MNCIVTAGPTWEPLDAVRRLTNLSTGRLGMELANRLADAGHHVLLFRGEGSVHAGPIRAAEVQIFTTTDDLRDRLRAVCSRRVDALFHAAAVSDFTPGRVWHRGPGGHLVEQCAGKLSTTGGPWMVELLPTPKILARLRSWFPSTVIVGWKYEVDGDRMASLERGRAQVAGCGTNGCVVNGPAYGEGYGWVEREGKVQHLPDRERLYEWLSARVPQP